MCKNRLREPLSKTGNTDLTMNHTSILMCVETAASCHFYCSATPIFKATYTVSVTGITDLANSELQG
jgi:hypothetical protein